MDKEEILDAQGKENMDLVNRMRAYKDPLLEEFDKEQAAENGSTTKSSKKSTSDIVDSDDDDEGSDSGETSSGDSDDESEGEDDIEFPRDNAPDILSFVQRDLVNLNNKEDGQKRKFALLHLYQIFVLAKNKAPARIYQEVLPPIQKELFKRLSDPLEKCRELTCLIIKEFFRKCDDLSLSIPYLVPVLVERLNADNIEGYDHLPEEMKPKGNQRAQEIADPVEKSEQVRIYLAEITTLMLRSTYWECMRPYVDGFVNICRAFCMDPYGEVILEGCRAITALSEAGKEWLVHFCEPMGRSLFTAFVHKHAKVRIAGLRALMPVLSTGAWKTSYQVFEAMVGFRDPNMVAIKDFYEPTGKVNYFGMFLADRSIAVRISFYKTIAKLLIELPDRVDHEGRLFPFLLSGLHDQHTEIRQITFEIIEEVGLQHEEQNEEKFRELKQFGYVPEWTFKGTIKDEHIQLPDPIPHRPRLGARILVRSYVRRYLKALYGEIGSWIEEH